MNKAASENLLDIPRSRKKTSDKLLLNKHNMSLIQNVKINMKVRLGEVSMTIDELFKLKENAVIKLDQLSHEPLELMLNDDVIALGELVVIDDHFGLKIKQVIEQTDSL